MLEVCLPGTGGMIPLENRWLTCCWLEYQGRAILIDCGEGAQIALKKAGCKISRLDFLLLTHYHADHVAGLPGLLLSLGNHQKTAPLYIIGPAGLKQVVTALTIIAPVLPYPVYLMELQPDKAGFWEADGIEMAWLPLRHRIPCLGYRITVKRKPLFNPQKAEHLFVPKEDFKTLHAGQSVTLEDRRVIAPEMVLDGGRPPIRVCYCTDTLPFEGIADFARGADLFVCEGMHGDIDMQASMQEKGHMLMRDGALLAKDAGADLLWLTHYSPAVKDPGTYLKSVQEIFPSAAAAYDGIRINLKGR